MKIQNIKNIDFENSDYITYVPIKSLSDMTQAELEDETFRRLQVPPNRIGGLLNLMLSRNSFQVAALVDSYIQNELGKNK